MLNQLLVAIYIRVSTKLQEDKYSLSAQLHDLTKYAESQGWIIVDTFKDVDSGAKFDKKGLHALLDCVEDGLVDVVLVVDQDRLSRLDTVDWELLKDVLRDNKVKIAEPGSMVDLDNEDQEFMSDLKNLIAKRERRSIKRRTGRGLRQYTREGKLWGRQPDEYNYDKKDETVSVNNEFAWVIAYIDKMFLEDGYGVGAIAHHLNSFSKTPNGRPWHANTIYTKLISKVYHGVFERTFSNGETIAVKDAYPVLRSRETYERILHRISTNSEQFNRYRNYNHPLAQLNIKCGVCGRKIALQQGQVDKFGKHKWYLGHGIRLAEPCPINPRYNALQIVRPLTKAVKDILLSEDTAKMYLDIDFVETDKLIELENKVNVLQKSIADNNQKLDKLLDLYIEGKRSKEKLDEKSNVIELENGELNQRLKETLKKLELIKTEQYSYEIIIDNLTYIEEHLASIHKLEEEYNDQDKEELFGSLFESAILFPNNNELILKLHTSKNLPLEAKIKIDEVVLEYEEQLLISQKARYDATQELLNSLPEPIPFMELKRLTGLNAQTLREDEKRFGTYSNLKLGKGSPERKAQQVKSIKKLLAKDPSISSQAIAKELGMAQNTVLKYFKEFDLREGRNYKNK
ncbi:site-specific DNA recombinase [Lysinibacillus sp. RC46]|uniref:recombinase family protein n=1 Tax=Lysinibacillus sp. RC46 TaxID=3156295 RepID=UPI003513F109